MGKFLTGNHRDLNPVLTGLICGFYPMVFYCSNNFWAVNSWNHFWFFLLSFIGISIAIFLAVSVVFKLSSKIARYRSHILFVTIIMTVGTLLSWAMYLDFKKKMLLALLIVSVLVALKLHSHYKKLLVLVLIMSVIPTVNCAIKLIEQQQSMDWTLLPDSIVEAKFKKTPNIYLIQPDGYVAPDMMESELYHFNNPMYDWLEGENFKVYNSFRSNYPASLSSNSSMLAMRQHLFGKALFPSIEMPHARDVLAGNNNAIQILKRNGYTNFFIVQDDYFQQNLPEQHYDYYNIDADKIPYFSNGKNLEAVVFDDLKAAMDTVDTDGPRFFFVEKLLPHHVHFSAPKEEERNSYIEKIKEVNDWLKNTVTYISEKDPEAIIIILADHGGWVGLGSYQEMFSTRDPDQINSVFSSLAAIKWNGYLEEGFDKELRSNVNVFRVLFSVLSENPEYLKYMEDNSSYILQNGTFYKSIRAAIDDQGNVLND